MIQRLALGLAFLFTCLLLIILQPLAAPTTAGAPSPHAVPTVLCGAPSFSRADYGTGGSAPNALAPGDFNGDGVLDLAVANFFTDTVGILLGNGDGTFRAPRPFAVGDYPRSLAAGAFHADNRLDLAAVIDVGAPTPADVALLQGNGNGTFSPPTPMTVGNSPWCVATGDFNQDSKQDLVIGTDGSDVLVLLGHGDGTFGSPLHTTVGNGLWGIATGDFNQDGKLDIAVAADYDSSVFILLGQGDGAFGPPRQFSGVDYPGAVVVADFNRDGKQDLALTTGFGSNDVAVLLGDGTGNFGPITHFPAGGDPTHLVAGDFNGDGNSDLAVANGISNDVSILQGDGTGSFAAPVNFDVFGRATAIAVADFNADGRPDLAVANTESANFTESYTISVLLNNCIPTVLPTATVPTSTPMPPTAAPPSSTSTPAPTMTACGLAFSDVRPVDYFYQPVQYLACRGVVVGYGDGTFRPYANTTRAQQVKIVVLGFGLAAPTPAPGAYTFADVPSGAPFSAVIETAATRQLVSGYACGGPGEPCDGQRRPYFRPNAAVTRGQLAKIVVAAAGWPLRTPGAPTFADVAPGSPFYGFVETATCHGVVSGYACGGLGEPCDGQRRPYYRPGTTATRGQIAKIVYGALTGPGACADASAPR